MSDQDTAVADTRGATVIDALRTQPGGRELLALGDQREDLALIGGAVRDLLLGRDPRELDVTVDAGAAELAAELARRLSREGSGEPTISLHDRFGTAAVAWQQGRVDIAQRRAESYARPGALPDVRAADAHADLARRDFTVNAIAVALGGPRRGRIDAVEHALDDLAAARLRVLHERSFLDDPTRLLRLGRYQARLGFQIEPDTERRAREAIAAGALATVSGARVGAELRLAAEDIPPGRALAALGELGVLAALSLPAPYDEQLLHDASALLPGDGSATVLRMAVLLRPAGPAGADARARADAQMRSFELLAEERERVLAGAFDADALAARIERAKRPSQLRAALAGSPVEAVAIAGARGPALIAQRARAWLSELRDVRLEIDGADLIAAGLAQGPDIGRRLSRVLDMRLDGELPAGHAAELRAALEAA